MYRYQRGITLVALVLTIVILLILATISFNALVGENGILKNVMEASQKTKEESAKEEIELAWSARMSKLLEGISNGEISVEEINHFSIAELNEELGVFGTIQALKYNETTREYKVVYSSESSNQNYEMKIDQKGKVELLKSNVSLSDYILGEEVVRNYVVILHYNNGSEDAEESITKGEKIGELPQVLTKLGYTFNGWYTEQEDGVQYYYSDGNPCITEGWNIANDVTLYGRWQYREGIETPEAPLGGQ